jgi:hypothetical protein
VPCLGDTGFLDSALPTFHDLTETEFKALVTELSELKTSQPQHTYGFLQLGVHPLMQMQGMTGPFATKVKELLLKYAGRQNLKRVAFMSFNTQLERWTFGGFDMVNGLLKPGTIVVTGGAKQSVTADVGIVDDALAATMAPANQQLDSVVPLLKSAAFRDLPPTQKDDVVRHVFRIENPTVHSGESIDCASCHVVHHGFKAALDGGYSPSDAVLAERYVSPTFGNFGMMASEPGAALFSMRAFGYTVSAPVVSQRIVNEAAAAVDLINARYLPTATQ